MRGRRPKPTHLKVLMGEPNLSRLNYAEPMPATNITKAPEWFNVQQKAYWDFVIANAPPGLLKQLDRTILEAWICTADTYRHAAELVAKQKSLLGKRAVQALAIRDKQAAILKSLAIELGFSPAARPRIQVSPEPDARASEFEKLMG